MGSAGHKFLEKVKATIAKYAMLSGGETVLIGLSGGPDSVCLLHVLSALRDELGLQLHALYVDHGLRPAEIPDEIDFCRTRCEASTIPFSVAAIEVMTNVRVQGMNKQEAARELRYNAFNETLTQIQGQRMALGHNADDQIETFLLRFLRGAGPKGLSGMPPVRKNIIRPLIGTGRREIEEFLDEQKITFLTDSSNLKEDYLRNRIRRILAPELKKINPALIRTTGKTMDILREEEHYFDVIVTKTLMRLITRKREGRIDLFLTPLEAMETVILRRVLRRAIDETKGLRGIEFVHIDSVIDLIRSGRPGDRLYLPKGLRVIKNYSTLVLTSELPVRIGRHHLSVPGETLMEEIRGVIRAFVDESADHSGEGKTLALFDADKAGTVLTVRPREDGDSFYPAGFGKRKKLQDFFVDEKVPRDERDEVPIVTAGDQIVWVAGFRGDERFRVTEETKKVLRLEFKKAL
jgi:tRNA(Ile)-lysidine synthase